MSDTEPQAETDAPGPWERREMADGIVVAARAETATEILLHVHQKHRSLNSMMLVDVSRVAPDNVPKVMGDCVSELIADILATHAQEIRPDA